jgi:N6-L-threonylcarbamoyladenine synthase
MEIRNLRQIAILGIESSCDETAAAVVRNGRDILSSVVASQLDTHARYGGVVPELASREHLRAIVPVVRQALEAAGIGLDDVAAIAVTQGPGLVGALLVGVTYAKALCFARKLPLIAVNHVEGHIQSVLLEHPEMAFPVLALVVSGGHTHLFELSEAGRYHLLGKTRDDAAGEAYDKVAKLLALGYPGGPVIDNLAKMGDPHAVEFTIAQIKHPNRVRRDGHKRELSNEADGPRFDFSYSGIKTAVLRYVETHNMRDHIEERRKHLATMTRPKSADVAALCDSETLNLVASFQRVMVNDLVAKTLAAAREYGIQMLFVSGGVAANSELRTTFETRAAEEGLPVYFPSRPLSTDNAAMIAAAAYPKWLAQEFAGQDLSADAALVLR